MKIVVDINHPAHVHYFKNFIWEMEKKGHETLITVSDKDIARQLLDCYGFEYKLLGSYGKGIVKKAVNVPILDLHMLKAVRKFNPDLFIGFCSFRGAHASKLMRKKSIAVDDTEHAGLQRKLYFPFVDKVLTPECFKKDLGEKQTRFKGTTDLLYLHPNRFTPNPAVLTELGLNEDDIFFVVRFISWDANHDIGQSGIKDREAFVHELAKHGKVFITSENGLPESLKQYQITVSPEKIHDLMYYATMFVGESGTMATEAACMGTHAVIVNSEVVDDNDEFVCGVFEFYNNYGVLFAYKDDVKAKEKIDELLENKDLRKVGKEARDMILSENDDVTRFLVDYVMGISSEDK